MKKQIYVSKEKRNAVIDEVILKLEELGYHVAIQHIKGMKN